MFVSQPVTLWSPPPAAAYLLRDVFAGSNGTNLTAHTMDVGAGWTNTYSTGFTLNGSGKYVPVGTAQRLTVADATQADVDVSTTCRVTGGGDYNGLAVRVQDASNFIAVCIYGGGTVVGWDIVGGSFGQIGSAGGLVSLNTDYTLRVKIKGATLTVYLNGTQEWTFTETHFLTPTKCGIFAQGAVAQTGSNFQAVAP